MTAAKPAGTLATPKEPGRPKGETPVRSPTYEITFRGQADAATCAEFDDC